MATIRKYLRYLKYLVRLTCYCVIVKPFLCIVLGVLVKGRENLRSSRQRIIVSNHNSHLDTIAILHVAGGRDMKRLRPVAAADYFCRSRALHAVMSALFDILPICRGPVRRGANPLDVLDAALDAGDSLILYPEGTRGEPERLARFHSGVGHLIRRHPEIEVVPVYLRGLGRVLPRGAWYPVPLNVHINIGEPRCYEGSPREITRAIREDIEALGREVDALTRYGESDEAIAGGDGPGSDRGSAIPVTQRAADERRDGAEEADAVDVDALADPDLDGRDVEPVEVGRRLGAPAAPANRQLPVVAHRRPVAPAPRRTLGAIVEDRVEDRVEDDAERRIGDARVAFEKPVELGRAAREVEEVVRVHPDARDAFRPVDELRDAARPLVVAHGLTGGVISGHRQRGRGESDDGHGRER